MAILKPDGSRFNHAKEVDYACSSLLKAIKELKAWSASLRTTGTARPGEVEALEAKLSAMSRLLDAVETTA